MTVNSSPTKILPTAPFETAQKPQVCTHRLFVGILRMDAATRQCEKAKSNTLFLPMKSSSRGTIDNSLAVPACADEVFSIKAGHLAFIILESQRMNPLFRSPINEASVQNILDLGTGDGAWVCRDI